MPDKQKHMFDIDIYGILGCCAKATHRALKQAFKKRALELHPDKNPDENAGDSFAKLNEVFKWINTDKNRAAFDKHQEQVPGSTEASASISAAKEEGAGKGHTHTGHETVVRSSRRECPRGQART